MDTITVGKTKVRISAEGCVSCGGLHSSGWRIERTIDVRIDNRRQVKVDISICADCDSGRKHQRPSGQGRNNSQGGSNG